MRAKKLQFINNCIAIELHAIFTHWGINHLVHLLSFFRFFEAALCSRKTFTKLAFPVKMGAACIMIRTQTLAFLNNKINQAFKFINKCKLSSVGLQLNFILSLV